MRRRWFHRSCLLALLGLAVGVFAEPAEVREPDEVDPSTQPDEIRRGMRMGDPPQERYRRYWESLGRRIEPTLQGDWARFDQYLEFFQREIVRDQRLFSFAADLSVDEAGGRVVRVRAEYREQAEAFARLLDVLGLTAHHDVRLIPEPGSGAGGGLGMVRAADADAPRRGFLRAQPDAKSEAVNEALPGEPVWLLSTDNATNARWLLCHSTDGYLGWIAAEAVERIEPDRFNAAVNARPASHAARVDAAIADAERRLGRPYVWGGRGEEGVDCSGLVQQAFASQGVHLPRDAEQQALVGRLVATRWHREPMRRGDVMFFLGRRGFVAHTAIYLGDGKLIESADGKVRVSDFHPGLPRWENFCFAKRVLE